jgi:breast cancer 2 susceptibility protein
MQLDSNGEGHEVLKALDMSRLLISGNSTSLARWHVRLGQQSRPFVATIRSLTPSGGVIALMDVRITRVFPLAFVDGSRGSSAGPWGADEEAALQDQWEVSVGVAQC